MEYYIMSKKVPQDVTETLALAIVPEIDNKLYVNFMTFEIMSKEDFDESVNSVSTGVKEKIDVITNLSRHAILHFHKTGDNHYVNKLINRLPNGIDIFALKTWFKAFAPLVYDAKTKSYVKDRTEDALPILVTNLENPDEVSMEKATILLTKAWAKSWSDFSIKKDPETPDFDQYLRTRLMSIVSGFEKLQKKRKDETPTAELQDIMSTVKGMLESIAA